MKYTLNEEQQRLVEDNHGLIFSYMKQHGLNKDSIEDWYGTLAIGLCNAAATYKGDKGASFSTYAYKCMHNMILAERGKRGSVPDMEVLSLDYDYSTEEGDCIEMSEMIRDESINLVKDVEYKDTIQRLLSAMNERDRSIVSMNVIDGLNARQIGVIVGLTRQRVNVILNSFKQNLRKQLSL